MLTTNIKVSIIIPVYNVEKYLPFCIESCINQTLKELEIILVNDGSTDNSLAICEKYAKSDSRIKVINKQNEGVSVARNIGIEAAQGEYIQFTDADDWLAPCALEHSYKIGQDNCADIIYFGFNQIEKGESFSKNIEILTRLGQDCSNLFELQWLTFTIWDKLYKKDFINKNNIRFIAGLKTAEDGVFNLSCVFQNPRQVFLPECLYNYRYLRPGSATETLKIDSEIKTFKYFITSKIFKKAPKKYKIMAIEKHINGILHWYNSNICKCCADANKQKIQKFNKQLIGICGKNLLNRCCNYYEFNKNFPYESLLCKIFNKNKINIKLNKFLFNNLRFNTKEENVTQIRIFHIPTIEFYTRYTQNNKKHCSILPRLKKRNYSNNHSAETFYLKVNRFDAYVFRCVQHWIDIINELNADFYIICDKPDLEISILSCVRFKNKNIKFLKSIKKPLHKIVENIATSQWINATYAHLTPFYHAKQHNLNNFWNIDADDTMFSLYADKVANILKRVKIYAEQEHIDAFSLDMHTSRTHGKHWSFGICYVNNTNKDWFKIYNNNKNTEWRNNYLTYDWQFNLDWFFTYLRDEKIAKIKSFYVDNIQFIHFGDFLWNTIDSGVYHFKNNRIIFPMLLDVFGTAKFGDIPIWSGDIKIDNDIKANDCFDFMMKFQTYLEQPSLPRDNMWLAEDDVVNV